MCPVQNVTYLSGRSLMEIRTLREGRVEDAELPVVRSSRRRMQSSLSCGLDDWVVGSDATIDQRSGQRN